MNTSHLKHVVNQNEEMYNPLNMDGTSAIIKGIFCSIGIPLNFSLAVTTLRFGRLYQTPHNIFLLAIVLSYLSFFIPPLMELIYWGLYPDESLCHSYVAVVTVPQGLSLVNKALALAEIYLAINHPLLHKRKMTPRLACYLTVFGSILTVFLLRYVYIAQLGTLRCELLLFNLKMMAIVFNILFTSCIAMKIVIYRHTKVLLRESRTLETTPNNGHLTTASQMLIHVSRKKIGKLEMEATQNLLFGVTSLCCIALEIIATHFSYQFGVEPMFPFFENLSLIPAIYSPIIYLMRNKNLLGNIKK